MAELFKRIQAHHKSTVEETSDSMIREGVRDTLSDVPEHLSEDCHPHDTFIFSMIRK